MSKFAVVPGKQPSARKIRAFLKRELATIDPDSVDVSQLARPLLEGPGLTYQDETITIVIALMPRSPAARGRTDIRPIGVYPMASRWGGSDALIRDAVKSKATRYGELDLPYVVAENCISEWGVDDEDILNALFGTEQFAFAQGSPTPVPSRRRDGALIGPNGPWNTRVSAVLVSTLFPWNLGACRLELYHNPWAAKPLRACSFALRQGTVLDGSVTWSGATELLSHFGLEPGWPDNSAG